AFFIMGGIILCIQEKEEVREKIKFVAPLAFIAAGALSLLAIIIVVGDWSFDFAISVMKIKPGFFIFMALSCVFISAGFSGVLFESDRKKNKFWGYAYWIFIFTIAVLYAIMPFRVNDEARVFVMANHIAMAITLTMALVLKISEFFTEKKIIKILGIIFLLITSFQLLIYKENADSFKHRIVTIKSESGDMEKAKKEYKDNDKTTDKKRHSN
ncbi:MAG: hypothetical protein KAI33_01575, partial [Elusimicrobiales bacterium]|nr:hypothetical protein [Elusimicrobiales bacterium]